MKYIFQYYGGTQETETGRAAGMKAMADWYARLGETLLDGGGPITANRRTVSPEGGATEQGIGDKPHGYTIVEAGSMDAAVEIARGCPLLKAGRSISILEVFKP
jgi:hypothetical protein